MSAMRSGLGLENKAIKKSGEKRFVEFVVDERSSREDRLLIVLPKANSDEYRVT